LPTRTVIFELRAIHSPDADLWIELDDVHCPLEAHLVRTRCLPEWNMISYVQEERGDELKWTIVAQHLANTHSSPTLARPRADNLFRLFERLLVSTLSATLDLDAPTLAAQLQRRAWTPITPYLSIWADARYATPSTPPSSQLPLYDVEVIQALTTAVASTIASSAGCSDSVLHSSNTNPIGPLKE
jgi:hypothetical protein